MPDPSAVADPHRPQFISYADFGERFFASAVTEQRVLKGVSGLSGREISFGPVGVGPIGLVKVSADGAVGTPAVTARPHEHVAFSLDVPVDLRLLIDTGMDKSRFTAAVMAHLTLTARAADPLKIVIDVEAPTHRNIEVDVQADGLRASVLQIVAGVDREIRKAVARHIRRELDKPESLAARTIDIGAKLSAMTLGR